MNPSKAKIAVGCTIAIAIPLLVIAAMVAGLFLKSFDDVREFNHQTVWEATQALISSFMHEDARLSPAERDRRDMNRAAWEAACPFAIFVVGGYFVPTIIAIRRKHPQAVAISALNILLGWSVLGWVGALVWSLVVTDDGNPSPAQRPDL
jgi:hypothetical protein